MIMGRPRGTRRAVFGRPRQASTGFRLAVLATLFAAVLCAAVLVKRDAVPAEAPAAILTQP